MLDGREREVGHAGRREESSGQEAVEGDGGSGVDGLGEGGGLICIGDEHGVPC